MRAQPGQEKVMPKAIRIHQYGGPEALRWEEVEISDPGPGQTADSA
jgi:hypothetical protein